MINSLKFLPKDFTTLKTPFTNFSHEIYFSKIQATVLHLIIQGFCLSLSVLHFIILLSGSKSVKFAQNFHIFLSLSFGLISHFSEIFHSRGNWGTLLTMISSPLSFFAVFSN